MNHLRELLDLPPERLAVRGNGSIPAGIIAWSGVQRHGNEAMCFFLGDITVGGRRELPVISELVQLPFETCWFEFRAVAPERSMLCGMLTIKKPHVTRFIHFNKVGHEWTFDYIAQSERFNSSEFQMWPAEPTAGFLNDTYHVIAHFLTALHCKNIHKVQHSPSDKLQKARAKRGKQPLFSYWTLHLTDSIEPGSGLGGTHSSPRVHLRRGHPRQYTPGKWTWVQPHVVGNLTNGMVHKDYDGKGFIEHKIALGEAT